MGYKMKLTIVYLYHSDGSKNIALVSKDPSFDIVKWTISRQKALKMLNVKKVTYEVVQ